MKINTNLTYLYQLKNNNFRYLLTSFTFTTIINLQSQYYMYLHELMHTAYT